MDKKYYLPLIAIISFFYACNNINNSGKQSDTIGIDTANNVKIVKPIPKITGDSLTVNDAEIITKVIYDTVKNEPLFDKDNPTDTMTRENATLKFLKEKSDSYYIYIVENRGPFAGVAVGWCDVFIFKKIKDGWILNDFELNAGGGGMYGNSGNLEKLVKMGDELTGIVISGGQSHMGNNFREDVIGLRNGKLVNGFSLPVLHDYGEGAGDDYKLTVCESNKYKFIKNNKLDYDLVVEKYNCVNKEQKVDSVIIPYKNGYKIPKRFLFGE